MGNFLDLAASNLLTPMVLFFVLGLFAAAVRSDLSVPEAVAKGLALYLVFAIGFKGGVEIAEYGLTTDLILAILAGIVLSALIPFLAYAFLKATTKLDEVDIGAIAAHYGSISIVTFVAGTQSLTSLGIAHEGYMVAVAAAMEAPAIFSGLWLAHRGINGGSAGAGGGGMDGSVLREIAFNGSIVLLVGAFFIGWITGAEGMAAVSPFIVDPFKGVLCLFLLDMGLVAGRGLRDSWRLLGLGTVLFGLYMPLIGAALGLLLGSLIGLSLGGVALLMTLSASASYIAVPAALRLALPEARTELSLTLSLGITFPFNLTIGIPVYIAVADMVL